MRPTDTYLVLGRSTLSCRCVKFVWAHVYHELESSSSANTKPGAGHAVVLTNKCNIL